MSANDPWNLDDLFAEPEPQAESKPQAKAERKPRAKAKPVVSRDEPEQSTAREPGEAVPMPERLKFRAGAKNLPTPSSLDPDLSAEQKRREARISELIENPAQPVKGSTTDKGGRPPLAVDLERLAELAELGLAIDSAGPLLGVTGRHLRILLDRDAETLAAWELGVAKHARWLAEQYKGRIERNTRMSDVLTMHKSKQPPERGGLGYVDNIQHAQIGGSVQIVLRRGVREQPKQLDDAIEAEYSAIDEE